MTRRISPTLFVGCLVLYAGALPARAHETERFVDDARVVLIEARTVQMGLDDAGVERMSEACRATGDDRCGPERFDRERGDWEVVVKPFFLDRSEVSRQNYYQCIEQGVCEPVDERACSLWDGDDWSTGRPIEIVDGIDRTPVTCVTFAEAEAYCRWARVRLPTEAEWAVAAGVGQQVYPWGDTFTGDEANYSGVVGHLENAARARGTYGRRLIAHLAGNAYEWVAGGHPCHFGETCTETDRAVIRGGSYVSSPGSLRVTYRRFVEPETRSGDLGFRCAADYAETPAWALPPIETERSPATEPEALPADSAPTAPARVVGFTESRIVLTDLDSGERTNLHRTTGEISSLGVDRAGVIGFSVRPSLGGLYHYVWAPGSQRPAPVLLPESRRGASEEDEEQSASWFDRTGYMSHDDEGLCVPTRLDPLEEDGPRTPTDGLRVSADGTVGRASGECSYDIGVPLETCRAEPSPYEIDVEAGTVAIRDDEGNEQVVFRVAPEPNLIDLGATDSCHTAHTIVYWSEREDVRTLSHLVILDSDARVILRSQTSYYSLGPYRDALSKLALWSPDRRYLLWADWRGWFAYDFARPPQRVTDSANTPPIYLQSGEEFHWPAASAASEPTDQPATSAPITTDDAGSRWVTLPGADPIPLFPVVDRPAESSCVEAADLSTTPVWIVSTEPETILAWTVPPRFDQRDECLYSWLAIPEPESVEVEPTAAHGISYSGEPTNDSFDSEYLLLQHDLSPRPGTETLRYGDHQLALTDASGEVLSAIPLRPPYSSDWEPSNKWGRFVQVAPAEWRLRVIHDSASDSTGHDGSYITTFTVTIGSDSLRLREMSYVRRDTYDPEEITDAIAATMVSWHNDTAPEGSPCWLDSTHTYPDTLGHSYSLTDESNVRSRRLEYPLTAGLLIGDRVYSESHSDEVLWPNTACGFRARDESVQVRWVLLTESGRNIVADQESVDTTVIGLEFGGH